MSSSRILLCCHRNRPLMICLLFLLISSLIQVKFMAEGRTISKLLEVAQRGIGEDKALVMRSLIGSRPPRCDRRCSSCEHCEAIQVPITTQVQGHVRSHFFAATLSFTNSRGDDISNYKPISWKCKCGNFIFNP
ncbi:hypothetical protein SLA2020_355800 [Shorea laevis]